MLWEIDFEPIEGRIDGVRMPANNVQQARDLVAKAYPDRQIASCLPVGVTRWEWGA